MKTLGAALATVLLLVGCGQDDAPRTGSNTLTVEVINITEAEVGSLRGELVQNVDYGQQPSTWTLLQGAASQTLTQLPEGEFDLMVVAEPAAGAPGKGVGCDLTFQMGAQEQVTITIDGLNTFGDKGYGPCRTTIDRRATAP